MGKTYTVKQVAQALDFSTNTVYKYLDAGKIKATRLGKEGRFRIPEEEVIRLLGLKGERAQIAPQIEVAQEVSQPATQVAPLPIELGAGSEDIIQKLSVPSLFDWFVATLAIFVGFSYLLFPAYVFDIKAAPYVEYIKFIKIILIIGGIGLLATDIFKPTRHIWHHLLHLILGLLFGVLAYFAFQTGHYPRMLGDGAIALLLLTTAIIHISDRARFIILINILAIIAGLIFILNPESTGSEAFAAWILGNRILFAILWYGLSALVLWASFSILSSKKGWLTLLLVVVASGAFSSAFINLQNNLWEDTVYAVVFGSYVLILPFWQKFHSISNSSKKELFGGFALMIVIFTVGIGLVFYLQTSFKAYLLSENEKRLKNAVLLVEQYLEESEKGVSEFAKDENLIGLVASSKKDKLDGINQLIKRFYLASSTLRRTGVIDKDGKGLVLYPEDSSYGLDLTERDYFKQAKESKKVVISDVLEPKVPGVKAAVIIAAPLLDKKGEFIGVIIGSVDFVKLANKLAGIKGTHTEFVIADRNKMILSHPDESQLLQPIVENNVGLIKAVAGESGQLEGYGNLGKLNLQAYAHIKKLGWGIVAQEPLSLALKQQSSVSFVIFLATVALGIGSLLIIIYLKRRA